MADIDIKGAAELKRALEALPAKIERNLVRGALRAGAVEILDEARAKVPVESGRLRESLRVTAGAKKGGRVYAHVKTDSPIAHLVEFGTRPHEIKPRRFPSLFFAGLFRKIVKHPGAKARSFMRDAFDHKSGSAVERMAEYLRGRIEKEAKAK